MTETYEGWAVLVRWKNRQQEPTFLAGRAWFAPFGLARLEGPGVALFRSRALAREAIRSQPHEFWAGRVVRARVSVEVRQ